MTANPPSSFSSSDRRPESADEGANNPSATEYSKNEEELHKEDIRKGKQKEAEEEKEKEEDGKSERELVEQKRIPSESGSDEPEEGGEEGEEEEGETRSEPPLPDEEVPPPLPDEASPDQIQDDGWEPVWDVNAQTYYFYNRFTGVSQWENPRLPGATSTVPPGVDTSEDTDTHRKAPVLGGYNPAIHGDYDPTAPYAQHYEQQFHPDASGVGGPSSSYVVAGAFNRFTGKWQPSTLAPENYNDENKSQRQMRAFFDVDAAANSHNGRSLKAERSGKKLSKKELKAFKDKRREKKEEKRRAWLRD